MLRDANSAPTSDAPSPQAMTASAPLTPWSTPRRRLRWKRGSSAVAGPLFGKQALATSSEITSPRVTPWACRQRSIWASSATWRALASTTRCW